MLAREPGKMSSVPTAKTENATKFVSTVLATTSEFRHATWIQVRARSLVDRPESDDQTRRPSNEAGEIRCGKSLR